MTAQARSSPTQEPPLVNDAGPLTREFLARLQISDLDDFLGPEDDPATRAKLDVPPRSSDEWRQYLLGYETGGTRSPSEPVPEGVDPERLAFFLSGWSDRRAGRPARQTAASSPSRTSSWALPLALGAGGLLAAAGLALGSRPRRRGGLGI